MSNHLQGPLCNTATLRAKLLLYRPQEDTRYTHAAARAYTIYPQTCVCEQVCMHMCTNVCTYMYAGMCMCMVCVCVYVCVHVCMQVCMYRYTCICTHTYICMHVCIYVCMCVCMHEHKPEGNIRCSSLDEISHCPGTDQPG